MNVFVRTRLFRDLIGEDPQSLLVDYASAYSIVPGRIHVEGLRIRGRDSHIEWILLIDRSDFRVSFSDLGLRRRFHADDVHGDGLSLRLRRRKPSFEPTEAAALPPVPGFSDPPFAGPTPPPLTDADYRLWSVWLEGVVADHVREIWIDTIRYTGELQIRGRWFFRPVRWLDVGPATLDVRRLDVSYGARETWVSGVSGHLMVTVHPFDVRAVEGAQILDRVSVQGDASGTARVAAIAHHLLDHSNVAARSDSESGAAGTRVERASVVWAAHAGIDHGVLRPGLWLHADPFDAVASRAGLDVDASVGVDVRVDDDGFGRVAVDARHLEVLHAAETKARVAAFTLAFSTRELNLSHPFSDATYEVDVAGARTASLGYWQNYFHVWPRLAMAASSIEAEAHVAGAVAQRGAEGRLCVDARRLSLGPAERGLAPGASVVLPRVTVVAPRLKLEGGGLLGSAAIDAPAIEIPSLSTLAALLPLPAEVAVTGGEARGALRLDVDLGEGTAQGDVRVAARDVQVRTGAETLSGRLEVAVRATRRRGLTDLSGSTLRFQGERSMDWWGALEVSRGVVSTRGGARLRAQLAGRAKDAGPFVSWIQSRADLGTKLALGVLPTAGLETSGEILLTPAAVEARSIRARADGFDMSLEFAKLRHTRTCALMLDIGPVRAGVDMTDGTTRVMLFGAEPWFASRVAALRALEGKSQ